MRSVDVQRVETMDSATTSQLGSVTREGRVTGRSLNTDSWSKVRRDPYLQQLPDSRPRNFKACRRNVKTLYSKALSQRKIKNKNKRTLKVRNNTGSFAPYDSDDTMAENNAWESLISTQKCILKRFELKRAELLKNMYTRMEVEAEAEADHINCQ
jgi:hypothetical protein